MLFLRAVSDLVSTQELLESEFLKWKSKLIVEEPTIRVHWKNAQRSQAHPLERTQTMLHDAPARVGLMYLPLRLFSRLVFP